MRRIVSLLAVAACVVVAVSCENRMVPSDVDKIPGSEPVNYAQPLYEQQNRIMGALDRLVGEIDVTKLEDAVDAVGVTGRAIDRLSYAADSAQLASLLKTFMDIFNAFTTGTGDNLKTMYDISQLQGNWTLSSTGVTFSPANGVLNVSIADSVSLNVVFSKKVKEYYIGKCRVPVKLVIGTKVPSGDWVATLPLTEEVYAETLGIYGGKGKKEPVTVIPVYEDTDLSARIPVGAEATLSIAGASTPAFTAAIALDASFSEPFITSYFEPDIQIEKLLGELGFDFGFAFKAGGYSLTLAKAAWSGGDAKIISAISKDGNNLLTEHFTLKGYKLNKEKFEYYAKLLGGGSKQDAGDSTAAEVVQDSVAVEEVQDSVAADSVQAEIVEAGVAGLLLAAMPAFAELAATDSAETDIVIDPVGPDRQSMLKALALPILGGDFRSVDFDVDILGYVQFKASLGSSSQIDDIVKYFMDAIYGSGEAGKAAGLTVVGGEVSSGLDSTTAFQYRARVNDFLNNGFYFGSDVRQSRLMLGTPIKNKKDELWSWREGTALWIVSDAVLSEDLDKLLRQSGKSARQWQYQDAQPIQAFFTGMNAEAWMKVIKVRLQMALPWLSKGDDASRKY